MNQSHPKPNVKLPMTTNDEKKVISLDSSNTPNSQSSPCEKPEIHVVCALIRQTNGEILICQRQPGGSCGNMWEFPGGKVEAGEKPEVALIRECREELAITIELCGYHGRIKHEYPDVIVHLSFFHAQILTGSPRKIVHQTIRWVTPGELDNYEFCPADEPVLRHLSRKLP